MVIILKYERYFAGISPDGLFEKYDIIILICYVLNNLKHPISKVDLDEIVRENGLVNYFSFVSTLQELINDGHISPTPINENRDDDKLFLTQKGVETANKLDFLLNVSLKEKIVAIGLNLVAKLKRQEQIEVDIKKVSDGYMVNCIVHDYGSDVMRLEMYAVDEHQANLMKNELFKNTSNIYRGLIGLLTHNNDVLRELADGKYDDE
jgi:hypothetical protein